VLSGSWQRSGDKVRITVQLLRVRDQHPLWAGKYEQEFSDIPAVQDAIAAQEIMER